MICFHNLFKPKAHCTTGHILLFYAIKRINKNGRGAVSRVCTVIEQTPKTGPEKPFVVGFECLLCLFAYLDYNLCLHLRQVRKSGPSSSHSLATISKKALLTNTTCSTIASFCSSDISSYEEQSGNCFASSSIADAFAECTSNK